MREKANKNMRNTITFLILGISSIFLLIINFIPSFVVNAGLTDEFTGKLQSDSSVYVNKSNPDKNYEEYWELNIGNFTETYLHFNLESLPTSTEELYFFLDFVGYENYCDTSIENVEINIILIDSNWNVSEITWNNKPQPEEIINTVNVTEIIQSPFLERYNLDRMVNLTKIFRNNPSNEISLFINITANNKNLACNINLYGFYLLWKYKALILSYTPIISTIIIFSMLTGTIYFLRKDIYYCKNCGNKRNLTERFCQSCGINFNKDIFIKGSDYQIVSIILWIITFFEVSFLLFTLLLNWISIFFPFIIFLLLPPLLYIIYKTVKKKVKQYKELRFYVK